MPAEDRDGNEAQIERSTSRLRAIAAEEMARVLEAVGIDVTTVDGRRELRNRLDYLDRLYDDQGSNRAGLDFARELLAMKPTLMGVIAWGTEKMRIEGINRDAVRKTLLDKAMGGLIWLLLGGLTAAIGVLTLKGHAP